MVHKIHSEAIMLHTASVRHVKSYQQDNPNVINIVKTEDEISATFEMLKIVHRYNQNNGWTLLVAPDNVPSRHLLDACSIDTNKLLVIRAKHVVDMEYMLNCALQNGRFAAVITWTDILKQQQLVALQLNTHQAKAQLYCFTTEHNASEQTTVPSQLQVC
ncbi:hypothetical protein CWC24_14175 [Pseudoalteromonas ruthenica]|nr:SulA-like leucine-rich domain-containing protein [Pseudoalteromonas ruthenica]TMO44433.1 hypothetical protein CWC24_14175 [Pseudoalteromonas ruthenica]TMO49643.1 hypothetical protein CWC23_14730 [Pseudoalteromonas ruthenica]